MVKKIIKISILILILGVLCFIGCNNDFLGMIASNDLDERLKERDNLKFLDERGWSTLPQLGDAYSFIVITDTHIEDGDAFGLEKLAGVVAANSDIKFAVVLGDITQHGLAKDIDKFIEIADDLGVPFYPVIGNHDFYFGNWPIWKEKIGSTSYRVDSDSTTLFILDSANSFFGKEQLDWLEREIKTAKNRVFVFTHTPLFADGPLQFWQISDLKERARIVSILSDKCDIMFMGHVHQHIENTVGKVRYIALEDFVKQKAYCIVTVTPARVSFKVHYLN
jgi:predicted phosphodiesterase